MGRVASNPPGAVRPGLRVEIVNQPEEGESGTVQAVSTLGIAAAVLMDSRAVWMCDVGDLEKLSRKHERQTGGARGLRN